MAGFRESERKEREGMEGGGIMGSGEFRGETKGMEGEGREKKGVWDGVCVSRFVGPTRS